MGFLTVCDIANCESGRRGVVFFMVEKRRGCAAEVRRESQHGLWGQLLGATREHLRGTREALPCHYLATQHKAAAAAAAAIQHASHGEGNGGVLLGVRHVTNAMPSQKGNTKTTRKREN
jgi:hypothetical protein